jgi:TolA-binding protein
MSLAVSSAAAAEPPAVGEPEVRRGISLVDDGEYDSAIIALDGAVRRLAGTPGHSMNDLAEAYFYLGVAYLGKGQETSAKARFREAVQQMRDMSPSPEKFPPRVIELFEKAKEESSAAAAATTRASAAEPKK